MLTQRFPLFSPIPPASPPQRRTPLLCLAFIAFTLQACHSPSNPKHPDTDPTRRLSWLEWQKKRHESIAGPRGWLTLVGRHWLEEGPNTCGQHPSNQIVIASSRAPLHIGVFTRTDRSVRFETAPDAVSTVAGQAVRKIEMQSDRLSKPTELQVSGLQITVIDRGERIGLRVRDPESEARFQFEGLKHFPYDEDWRVKGRYQPLPEPRVFQVETVVGASQEYRCPGRVLFLHRGVEYSLDVFEEEGEEDFFVLFKDGTSGCSTYSAGRFIYVPKPDANGSVWIDFNRAYTPPCGFTPFATCPLPPRQNWLRFSIRAGERAPSGHEH